MLTRKPFTREILQVIKLETYQSIGIVTKAVILLMRYTDFFPAPCSLFPVPCSLFYKAVAFSSKILLITSSTTRSGVDAPEVTPTTIEPEGSQFRATSTS